MRTNLSKLLENAIQAEDVNRVHTLIGKGVDVNAPFRDGTLPLDQAAGHRNPGLLEQLLKAGADVNGISKSPKYPGSGQTALGRAAALGDIESVKVLLRAGADVNKAYLGTFSPLHAAASGETEEHVAVVRALIEAGADVEGGDSPTTPLMWARLPETVGVLLAAGADVNAVRWGGTALHWAIDCNQPEIVSLLLEQGADPMLRSPPDADEPNLTALELAKVLKHRRIIPILERACGVSSTKPSRRPAPSGSGLWAEIKSGLKESHPDVYLSFRPGAQAAALQKLEQLIGEALPPAFRAFYEANDGQKNGEHELVPPDDPLEDDVGYYIMSIREVIKDWKEQKELTDMGEFAGRKASADKQVRKEWWNTKWIPFASNGAGDYLCLDLAPTAAGSKGQVISVSHESTRRRLLGPSFEQWLADLWERLQERDDDEDEDE
jgi:cell wall assembly regulator SMI1/ankyrin repeat protein